MEKFEVTILGCGSALPTRAMNQTSQVVNFRDKLFMIDCGEGTQLQYRKAKLNFVKLQRIFISHLHGDHCFGVLGLVSTFGLLGRTADLHIHCPQGYEQLLRPSLDFFCNNSPFKVLIHEHNTKKSEVIYEDRSLTVTTIPLKHRIACAGFLFQEKPRPKHIDREQIDYYEVPISWMNRIKAGDDYVAADGKVVANDLLTKPAKPQRSYAYCSDTAYLESIIEVVKGATLLFHEATFASTEAKRADQTNHSTAKQAATIAQKAEVKQLLIGHFSARYPKPDILLEEARSVFVNTIAAEELETYVVG